MDEAVSYHTNPFSVPKLFKKPPILKGPLVERANLSAMHRRRQGASRVDRNGEKHPASHFIMA